MIAGYINHGRAAEFLLDERPGRHVRADVAGEHQHVAVLDRNEFMEFWLVMRAHLQVQVGGDLNFHDCGSLRGARDSTDP